MQKWIETSVSEKITTGLGFFIVLLFAVAVFNSSAAKVGQSAKWTQSVGNAITVPACVGSEDHDVMINLSLTMDCASDPKRVVLTWNDINEIVSESGQDTVKYDIYRCDGACVEFIKIGSVPDTLDGIGNYTFSDSSGVPSSSTYQYQIEASDAVNKTAYSNIASIVPTCGGGSPELSADLTAEPSSGAAPLNGVDLFARIDGTAQGAINYSFDCNPADGNDTPEEQYKGVGGGLVGHWKFDEAADGNIVARDSSGYDNVGTLINGPVRLDGKLGRALDFNGSSNYVEISDSASLDASQMTFSAWIRTTDDQGMIAERYSYDPITGGHGWRLEVWPGGTLFGAVFINGNNYNPWPYGKGPVINDGSWHHVAMTADGSTGIWYFDGNVATGPGLNNPFALAGPVDDTDAGVTIGNGVAGFFNGVIDDVRLYNRSLSAGEIKDMYDANVAGYLDGKKAVDICSYPVKGDYFPKVTVTRGGKAAEDTTDIPVSVTGCTDDSQCATGNCNEATGICEAAPNFFLEDSGPMKARIIGNSSTWSEPTTISVTNVVNFSDNVKLSRDGSKPVRDCVTNVEKIFSGTYNFDPSQISSPYSSGSEFKIRVAATNPPGCYKIPIKGEGGGISREHEVKLNVDINNPSYKEVFAPTLRLLASLFNIF
ncbi:LamG domain-containing protein [Candidatus Giovannonibacteria bacterium]|nr:LamG domain-containing protein [Candidatus Giovannonibacteria bacterium]